MKSTIFNSFAIFVSILGSFSVERYIQDLNTQSENETLSTNVLYELEQNYFSLLATRASLKSVVDVTDSILINWPTISAEKVKEFYFQNQYALRDNMTTILGDQPSFDAKKMYFESLINSGLILKINNEQLRNELEEIYDVLQFRYQYGRYISNNIGQWFNDKMIIHRSLDQSLIFNEHHDFELYKYLNDRRRIEVGRLYGVENTIEKLKKLIDQIKKQGIF